MKTNEIHNDGARPSAAFFIK